MKINFPKPVPAKPEVTWLFAETSVPSHGTGLPRMEDREQVLRVRISWRKSEGFASLVWLFVRLFRRRVSMSPWFSALSLALSCSRGKQVTDSQTCNAHFLSGCKSSFESNDCKCSNPSRQCPFSTRNFPSSFLWP